VSNIKKWGKFEECGFFYRFLNVGDELGLILKPQVLFPWD